MRGEDVAVSLLTSCAHCGRELHIDIDSAGWLEVHEDGAAPLLFEPHVDWEQFQEPHIIDDF